MTKNMPTTFTLGTRQSALAQWQTGHVRQLLEARYPGLRCTLRFFVTKGDKTLDRPLPQIGGKGLFTLELEKALLRGEIDAAVHSLKDLPVDDAPGLTTGAIVDRADVRDVLVARSNDRLATLPAGSMVGTSSLRRQAQLLHHRPDLVVRSIRGNVETRIRKVSDGDYDAAILAAAGVTRLGLDRHISEWLSLDTMLPAPGQGALAVQCRADDEQALALLAGISNEGVRACVTAERSFLSHLGGGCSIPVGAYCTSDGEGWRLRGLVASPDGRRLVRVEGIGDEPRALGASLAAETLARGAGEILADV